jgi:hypothetical protein
MRIFIELGRSKVPRLSEELLTGCLFHFIRIKNVLVTSVCFVSLCLHVVNYYFNIFSFEVLKLCLWGLSA